MLEVPRACCTHVRLQGTQAFRAKAIALTTALDVGVEVTDMKQPPFTVTVHELSWHLGMMPQ